MLISRSEVDPLIDADLRPTFAISREAGVWGLYRRGRVLHRSRDPARIGRLATELATAEASRTGRPVKVVQVDPETGETTSIVFRRREDSGLGTEDSGGAQS